MCTDLSLGRQALLTTHRGGKFKSKFLNGPFFTNIDFSVDVQSLSANKTENSPYFKKEEPLSKPKSEHLG